jgi:hypothetical protein
LLWRILDRRARPEVSELLRRVRTLDASRPGLLDGVHPDGQALLRQAAAAQPSAVSREQTASAFYLG